MTASCCWFLPVFHSLFKDLITNHKLSETEYIIVEAVIVIMVFTISDQSNLDKFCQMKNIYIYIFTIIPAQVFFYVFPHFPIIKACETLKYKAPWM